MNNKSSLFDTLMNYKIVQELEQFSKSLALPWPQTPPSTPNVLHVLILCRVPSPQDVEQLLHEFQLLHVGQLTSLQG